jgi:Flp pilus assembly protein TadB
MASRKQRRRRAKDRRHEYEYVYVDEEGNEVEVDPEEVRAQQDVAKQNGSQPARGARRQPKIEPPSWQRVGKRSLLIAPLMFLTIVLLGGDLTLGQQILQTILLLAMFLVFTYLFESLLYRRYLKKTGGQPGR